MKLWSKLRDAVTFAKGEPEPEPDLPPPAPALPGDLLDGADMLEGVANIIRELASSKVRTRRIIVHDEPTFLHILTALPDNEPQFWGIPVQIDAADAPEAWVAYVDHRPAEAWANRRKAA